MAASVVAALFAAGRSAHAVTGAELARNTPHRYGLFEARLMFAPGDGIVSSMFLWKLGSELAGTYWNEIDIEKVGTDCTGYSSNAIYGEPETHSTARVSAGVDLCSGYHTHSIEWTPDHLIWRLDGAEKRRLSAVELAAFEQNATTGMQIRFNLWVGNASFGGNFQSSSLPARQYLDWVTYASYTPGAGAGGSDFTPLWREDFAAPLGSEWSYGTWASPLGNSVHSPANVTVSNGIGVLSLTEDGATGFAGTPPPGEPAAAAGRGGSAGSGALDPGSGGSTSGAGASGSTSAGAPGAGRARSDGTCALGAGATARPASSLRSAARVGGMAWLGALALRARRRSRH